MQNAKFYKFDYISAHERDSAFLNAVLNSYKLAQAFDKVKFFSNKGDENAVMR
jgi:hypothetical protein